MDIKNKIKYFIKGFDYLRVYNSPFKPPIPKLYVGKVAIGTPWFFPRVFKKATPEKAREVALKEIEEVKKYNEREQTYKRTVRTFDDIYAQKIKSSFAQPKKIGFDFVSLGFKTKWTSTDFRHEWNPIWSFVCFGYQIALIFVPEHDNHFWEAWLYYTRQTDKKLSVKERIALCRKKAPQKWSKIMPNNVKVTTDYYTLILKKKWL